MYPCPRKQQVKEDPSCFSCQVHIGYVMFWVNNPMETVVRCIPLIKGGSRPASEMIWWKHFVFAAELRWVFGKVSIRCNPTRILKRLPWKVWDIPIEGSKHAPTVWYGSSWVVKQLRFEGRFTSILYLLSELNMHNWWLVSLGWFRMTFLSYSIILSQSWISKLRIVVKDFSFQSYLSENQNTRYLRLICITVIYTI